MDYLEKHNIKKQMLAAALVLALMPLYWMVSLAIRSSAELGAGGLTIYPRSLSLEHIQAVFTSGAVMRPLLNSLTVTLLSLAVTMASGIAAAYVLGRSRLKSWINRPFLAWVLIIRVLPPITLAIPLFLMFNRMGLLGTRIPVILSHIMMNLPFVIWFLIPAIRVIPGELDESARIDGATEGRLFFSIILPLILPSAAAAGIFTFMYSWNEYLYAVIFVQSPSAFTLPVWLSTMNSEQEVVKWGELASGGIVSVMPLLTFALLMQQYLISGMGEGAVKE
ncbi:MAG: carbohydrate ABC transporter permease [Spirochaetales bacterium]|nr:carbohydrate ABC transporter permease [Spirochaetales bacterium]